LSNAEREGEKRRQGKGMRKWRGHFNQSNTFVTRTRKDSKEKAVVDNPEAEVYRQGGGKTERRAGKAGLGTDDYKGTKRRAKMAIRVRNKRQNN